VNNNEGHTSTRSLKMVLSTVSPQNAPSLLAITLTYIDLDNFVRNVTENLSHQNVHYFLTSLNECFCTTLQNRKCRNCVFSPKCCMLLFQQAHKAYSKLSPGIEQMNHILSYKNCVRQDLGRVHITYTGMYTSIKVHETF